MGYLFERFFDGLGHGHLTALLLAVAAVLIYVALRGSLRAKRTAAKVLP